MNCNLVFSQNNFVGKYLITDRGSDVSRRKFWRMLGLPRDLMSLINKNYAVIKAQIESKYIAFRIQ